MHICYIDEAGCTGILPSLVSDIQPVFVLGGIIVDQTRLHKITRDFLALKRRYFPGGKLHNNVAPATNLDWVLFEAKGADLRRMLADGSGPRRSAISFLSDLLKLLEAEQVRFLGRLLVKGNNIPINGRALYTFSLQDICLTLQDYLRTVHDEGFVIADSRNKEQNAIASHSIFTQKFKAVGDDYSRILEMPSFGHSENHAGIQIADLLCSALLFPMAIDAFCLGVLTSCHVRGNNYRVLREKFGATISHLQHRYLDAASQLWRGGIFTKNALTTTHPKYLLRVN
jgi:Protein of unknown function (DUF3800)